MQRPFSPGRLSGAQIPRLAPGAVQTAAEAAPTAAEAVPATACPRCRGKLADPEGLGYCPRCGFCRAVEREKAQAQTAAAQKQFDSIQSQISTATAELTTLQEQIRAAKSGTNSTP